MTSREKQYYTKVEEFLTKELSCQKVKSRIWINLPAYRETRRSSLMQIDVAGIKSGKIHAVEVKDRPSLDYFMSIVSQALGYSVCADYVYAAINREFIDDEIKVAKKLGIGLIEISGKTCKLKCRPRRSRFLMKLFHEQALSALAL